MQYFLMKDEETGKPYFVSRFITDGIGEIWKDGKWTNSAALIGMLQDGLLEEISEIEAKKLISQRSKSKSPARTPQPQTA